MKSARTSSEALFYACIAASMVLSSLTPLLMTLPAMPMHDRVAMAVLTIAKCAVWFCAGRAWQQSFSGGKQ